MFGISQKRKRPLGTDYHYHLETTSDRNASCIDPEHDYPSPPMSGATTPEASKTIAEIPVTTITTTATPVTTGAITSPSPYTIGASSAPSTYVQSLSTSPHRPSASGTQPIFAPHDTFVNSTTEASHLANTAPSLSITTSGLSAFQSPLQVVRSTRRAKTHVASACVNCRRAHLSCDVQRPCRRCIGSGRQDTCQDVEHKKRGRPRLRAAEGPSLPASVLAGPSNSATPFAGGNVRPIAQTRARRAESFRSHHSRGSGSSSFTPVTPYSATNALGAQGSLFDGNNSSAAQGVPRAFLDLDLVVLRANDAFQQVFRAEQGILGSRLHDLARPAGGESFTSMRNRLRDEREQIEPSYLPPIMQSGQNTLWDIRDEDIDQLTHYYADSIYMWTLVTGGEPFPARVRLAKASTYFVVVTLPPQLISPPSYHTIPSTGQARAPTQSAASNSVHPTIGYTGPNHLSSSDMPQQVQQQPYLSTAYPTMSHHAIQPYVGMAFNSTAPSQIMPTGAQRMQFIPQSRHPMTPRPPYVTSPTTYHGATMLSASPAEATYIPQQSATDRQENVDEDEEEEEESADSGRRTTRKRRRLGIDEVLQ